MTRWDKIQERARKLINEGMTLLKSSAHDAELLAETTTSAAKLHMDVGRKRIELYRTLHDLGTAVYEASIEGQPEAFALPITPVMKDLISKVGDIVRASEEDAKRIKHISVVKGTKSAQPSITVTAGKPKLTPTHKRVHKKKTPSQKNKHFQ